MAREEQPAPLLAGSFVCLLLAYLIRFMAVAMGRWIRRWRASDRRCQKRRRVWASRAGGPHPGLSALAAPGILSAALPGVCRCAAGNAARPVKRPLRLGYAGSRILGSLTAER